MTTNCKRFQKTFNDFGNKLVKMNQKWPFKNVDERYCVGEKKWFLFCGRLNQNIFPYNTAAGVVMSKIDVKSAWVLAQNQLNQNFALYNFHKKRGHSSILRSRFRPCIIDTRKNGGVKTKLNIEIGGGSSSYPLFIFLLWVNRDPVKILFIAGSRDIRYYKKTLKPLGLKYLFSISFWYGF